MKADENVKMFFEKVEKDAGFREKLDAFMGQSHTITKEKVLKGLSEFAKAEGFNCSYADFETVINGNNELSDENLKMASGGVVELITDIIGKHMKRWFGWK